MKKPWSILNPYQWQSIKESYIKMGNARFERQDNRWIAMKMSGQWGRLEKELYILSSGYYSILGAHPYIDSNLMRSMSWRPWKRPEAPYDAYVIIGHEDATGFKVVAIGHDGLSHGKKQLIDCLCEVLNEPGYWTECDILRKELLAQDVDRITSQDEIEDLVGSVEMTELPGEYERDGQKYIIFGKPVPKTALGISPEEPGSF